MTIFITSSHCKNTRIFIKFYFVYCIISNIISDIINSNGRNSFFIIISYFNFRTKCYNCFTQSTIKEFKLPIFSISAAKIVNRCTTVGNRNKFIM